MAEEPQPVSVSDKERELYIAAFETFPLLTRAVFLLACRDNLTDDEISWRCGISPAEVRVRIVDALVALDRCLRMGPSWTGRVRRASLEWRHIWATAREREGMRRIARWLAPQNRPGPRRAIDGIAWVFERIFR